MINTILTTQTVSVTDLKRNFSAVLDIADNEPVAVLNHNKPEAYILSAAQYQRLLERLEDLEDAALALERAGGPFEEVVLENL